MSEKNKYEVGYDEAPARYHVLKDGKPMTQYTPGMTEDYARRIVAELNMLQDSRERIANALNDSVHNNTAMAAAADRMAGEVMRAFDEVNAERDALADAMNKAGEELAAYRASSSVRGDNRDLWKERAETLREKLEKAYEFICKASGTCLGIALSTDHPNPEEKLQQLFEEGNELALSFAPILKPEGKVQS